jgi:hypothetical protein
VAHIDHPIGDLAHAQASGMAQLLLLLLAGVWMVRVAMQPGFEIVRRLLGELPAFFGGTIDEGGRGDGLRGAGRGRWRRGHSGRGRRLGRGEGSRRRVVVAGGQDELLIGKGPLLGLGRVGPPILLARDAARVREHVLPDGGAEGRVAKAVLVLELEGRAAGGRAGAGDRGRGVGPLVGVDELAQIRGGEGGHRRGGVRGLRVVGVLGVGGEGVWVGGPARGLRVRGRPVAGVRSGVGGAGEGRATGKGVLEGGEDGGELDLWGVGVVWLGRGGGRRLLFDAARVGVGHASWGESRSEGGGSCRFLGASLV